MGSKKSSSSNSDGKSKKKFENQITNKKGSSDDKNVLLNLPAGLKYKIPGRRQRVLIGGIVIGLNALLVLCVVLYFYSPAFQEFVYNFGR
tara:strand:- start:278 stop:547 length:270 start_codon:yes stop_codon:yes gene_type:complete